VSSPPSVVVAAGLAVILGGCAMLRPAEGPPGEQPNRKAEVVVAHLDAAQAYFSRGDLARARREWQVARAMDRRNPAINRKLQQVRALVASRSAERLALAHDALRRRDERQARRHLLAVLALDPDNREAIGELRRIEGESQLATERAKLQRRAARRSVAVRGVGKGGGTTTGRSDESPEAALAAARRMLREGHLEAALEELRKQRAAYAGDARVGGLLAEAHVQLAEQMRARGDYAAALENLQRAMGYAEEPMPELETEIRAMKVELAEQYYRRGLRVYREDPDAAIRCWEQSTTLNPQHLKARLRLEKARKARGGQGSGEEPDIP